MTEKDLNLDFEWQNRLGDIGDLEDKIRGEADVRLRRLIKGHTDITGASIILENVDKDTSTPYLYRARIVTYTRPDDINGTEEAETPLTALRWALDVVERQVREKLEKLRERWKQQ